MGKDRSAIGAGSSFRRVLITAVILASSLAQAYQRLVLVGGGDIPESASRQFVELSGGKNSNLVVLTWASSYPEETFEGLKARFATYQPEVIQGLLRCPKDAQEISDAADLLKQASGIFLSGGNQNRFMNCVLKTGLAQVLHNVYFNGTVMGGTSAGTAVASEKMFTGAEDLTVIDPGALHLSAGLGLLPAHVFVDQHFIVRMRHNRLISAVLGDVGSLGLGVDEDNAMLVKDNREVEMLGPAQSVVVVGQSAKEHEQILLKTGDVFDLSKRTVTRRNELSLTSR